MGACMALGYFWKVFIWLDAGDSIGPLPCELSEPRAFIQRGHWGPSNPVDNGGCPDTLQKETISPPSQFSAVNPAYYRSQADRNSPQLAPGCVGSTSSLTSTAKRQQESCSSWVLSFLLWESRELRMLYLWSLPEVMNYELNFSDAQLASSWIRFSLSWCSRGKRIGKTITYTSYCADMLIISQTNKLIFRWNDSTKPQQQFRWPGGELGQKQPRSHTFCICTQNLRKSGYDLNGNNEW